VSLQRCGHATAAGGAQPRQGCQRENHTGYARSQERRGDAEREEPTGRHGADGGGGAHRGADDPLRLRPAAGDRLHQERDGVYGSTTSPITSGVYGHNDDIGYGVAGRADSGTGTLGDSANGIGVLANSPNGTALSVSGTAKFSRSGMVSIPYPAKTATVTVPGGLSASALVLALM
jgi:hypothetical protein